MMSLAPRLTGALAAFALAAAPAAAAPAPLAPASEQVQGSELHGRGPVYWLLPALIIVALLIAITRGEDSGPPASP